MNKEKCGSSRVGNLRETYRLQEFTRIKVQSSLGEKY